MCPELADELGRAVQKLLTLEAGMKDAKSEGNGDPSSFVSESC